MSLDAEILRKSFARVIESTPDLTQRFYRNLFRLHPQTRKMFGPHLARQEKMLSDALVAVIDHVDDAPWLSSTLIALGARHAAYGVNDEMYGWVGDALLVTLADALGAEWTRQTERAWAFAFNAIAGLMQEGARRALAADPEPTACGAL